MKLLVIHPHLDVLGGSEELTRIMVQEMARRGIEVRIVTARIDWERFSRWNSVDYVFVKRVFNGGKGPERFYELSEAIYRAIESFNPDAVLSMLQETAYIAAVKLFFPDMPCGIYIHFPIEEELSKENIEEFRQMYRFVAFSHRLYYLADVRMVNSLYTARTLYRLFGLEANVVYPAIDWIYIENQVEDLGRKEPTIISVGRFVPQKRFDLLIKVFRDEVKKLCPEAKLVIAGTPDPRYKSYFEKVRSLAEEVKDVEIRVRPSYRELLELYQMSKVYAHLREGEHFGMAPLEGMAQGAIAVLSRVSGIAEVFEPGTELITYGSDDEIGKVLVYALRMDVDTALKIYRRIRAKISFFTPSRFVSEVCGYLRAAIEARPR